MRGTPASIDNHTTLFWFRRDLRITDNTALYHALKEQRDVLPLFIFDTRILDHLDDKADRRVTFIHQSVQSIKSQLEALGSSLLVVHTDPVRFFAGITPQAVYINRDYEPYARDRDNQVSQLLALKGCELKTFKDHVIFEKNEIIKDNGEPYTVFTPYRKRWKATVNASHVQHYPTETLYKNLKKTAPLSLPSLADIGFEKADVSIPAPTVKPSIIKEYHTRRDFPGVSGTSRLSVHLRFGSVSIRELMRLAQANSDTWLDELVWREFYQMILWHFPHVDRAFKPAYDNVPWRNNEKEFEAWTSGRTGYPIVDAGMRELNATGFMHNRVRMITASFLTKHLLIDWRWGEAYFAGKLLDFELASNNGGWQWAAGSGCDAAPYFRVFNPQLQAKKFDPDLRYIKQWVPEFGTDNYPPPIVDHTEARDRAIRTYQQALGKR